MSAPHGSPLGCPACGGQVVPSVGAPDRAPWLCNHCRRLWWHCELGVAGWRPDGCWPRHVDVGLRTERAVERMAASERGVSVRPDQLGVVGVDALRSLGHVLKAGVAPTPWGALVRAAMVAAGLPVPALPVVPTATVAP